MARSVAVIIGQNSYPAAESLQPLAFAQADAVALTDLLSAPPSGTAFDQVHQILDGPHHTALSELEDILADLDRDDLAFVYYSGHGLVSRQGRLHLAFENTNEKRLTSTAIKVADLLEVMQQANARKRLLLLDCCYAGAVGAEFNRSSLADQVQADVRGSGTVVMAATTKIDVAKESPEYGHGVFTKHLLDGLSGAADLNEDGHITAQELYDYVHTHVTRESHQKPLRFNLDTEGQIVLRQTGLTPWRDRASEIRATVLSLAAEGSLSDRVLQEALPLLSLAPSDMRQDQRARFDLLAGIDKDSFRPGPFSDTWDAVQAPSSHQTVPETAIGSSADPVTILSKHPATGEINATEWIPPNEALTPADTTPERPKPPPKYPDPLKIAEANQAMIPPRPPPKVAQKGYGYQVMIVLGFCHVAFLLVILLGMANGGQNSLGLVLPFLFGTILAVINGLAGYSRPFAMALFGTAGYVVVAGVMIATS